MYTRLHPCLKEKIIYIIFICLTFILLMLTLTTTGWEGGHEILHAGGKWVNGDDFFGYYFCILLLALICIGLSIIFILFSFYKDLIVNNIVFTTRSFAFVPVTLGFCIGSTIWIPVKTGDSISDLGYDYVILICATVMSVGAFASGIFLTQKLRKLKPDWRQDALMCKFMQDV